MHIIKFQGGLGNQMFQYALYRKFETMGKDTYADMRLYNEHSEAREFGLPIFGIKLREASRPDVLRLSGNEKNYIDRIILRLNLKKTYYREADISYKPAWLNAEEGYYNGYWQSERYFADIRLILLEEFQFPMITDRKNQIVEQEIVDTNSISIHLRRGDYLNKSKQYGGICTDAYYKHAIAKIRETVDKPHFFIFSNDIEFSKKSFSGSDYTIVESNSEETGYIDMCLMSKCKHNIIANSSFSWWGAWLNRNPDKQVISPKRWINDKNVKDVWCEGWQSL